MDKKIFVKIISAITALLVIPLALLIFLASKKSRVYYLITAAKISRCTFETNVAILIKALEMSEDHRFRNHWGIDPIGIARAIKKTLLHGRLEGASTIEQQYVRTCTLQKELSVTRKLEEISIAVFIAINHTKDDIAYSYLKYAYFGEGLIGYKATIRALHAESESKILNDNEAVFITSLLKRPKPKIPNTNWKTMHEKRAKYIFKLRYKSTDTHYALENDK